jgi:hypothetical protein
MKALRGAGLAALTLGIAIAMGCGHQSAVPVVASGAISPPDGSRLPFDREAQSGGISPTSSVVPPGAQLPSGTAIVIHLRKPLSSARVHPNDSFAGVLDEPIIVNDRIFAEPGSLVTGRVVEASSTSRVRAPGFMRLTLSSISIDGKVARVRTSSAFFKGASPQWHATPMATNNEGTLVGAVASGKGPVLGNATVAQNDQEPSPDLTFRDAAIGPERQLRFRLIDPLPIRP